MKSKKIHRHSVLKSSLHLESAGILKLVSLSASLRAELGIPREDLVSPVLDVLGSLQDRHLLHHNIALHLGSWGFY